MSLDWKIRGICNDFDYVYDKKNRIKNKKQKPKTKDKQARFVDVQDAELLSKDQLKRIKQNRTCATRVSGKRKHKLLKRIRHQQKEKIRMDNAQGILDIVQHHTSRDLVKINPTKSEAVLYNAKGSNISTLQFEDNDINITNETKHLGIKRNEQNRANISERIRTGRATIYSLLGAGLHVRRGFSPMVAYKLWRTYAVPRSIYGLEVMNLLAKEKDMLELAERKSSDKFKGFQIIQQIWLSIPCSYYIENPLNKIEWKRLVGIKIKEYWKNECHNEKMEKTSLKYIEIQNNPLNEAHNIWKSVKNNSKDVKAGEIKARISTQTYIFQAKRANSFSKPGNSSCPETDEKGNIFYVEIAEKCKQLKIKNSHESSIDDVGYGTDNEVNNIHNIVNQQITSPNGNLLSKGCHIANCRCNQNDDSLEFHRMDNLVQFKIPIKHVNIAKILGDTPKPHSYVGRVLCKDLFGIIPGHFKSTKCSNHRLCIRGLDPTRDILKKKNIQIGDCLRLVNGQEITWNNIDEVFTRLCSSSEVHVGTV
ncbi:unnamed protein product [Mytilus edulis]|uniref:Uncharacterized protein n=1 Tax=Mytilus edulis TaxID=6550 RepID=A0A8S3ULN9_MYTED|nr:unnamed protein product [Mytilus edulis]